VNLETRAVTRDITSMHCRSMASNLHLGIQELLGEFVSVFDGSVVWERGGQSTCSSPILTYHVAVALVSIQTIGSSYLNGCGHRRHLEQRAQAMDKSLSEKKEAKCIQMLYMILCQLCQPILWLPSRISKRMSQTCKSGCMKTF